jgi:hypothetical protein
MGVRRLGRDQEGTLEVVVASRSHVGFQGIRKVRLNSEGVSHEGKFLPREREINNARRQVTSFWLNATWRHLMNCVIGPRP